MIRDLLRLIEVFKHSVQGIILTNVEGTILYVNQAICHITGYSAEEVLGQNAPIFQSGRQNESFNDQLWSEVKKKGYWQGERWNRRKNGEEYLQWMNIIAITNEDNSKYYLGVLLDTTEQRKNEESLRLSSKVINNLLEGVMITDSSRRIISVNPAFTQVTGYNAEEVIGKSPRILQSGKHSLEFYQEMNQSLYQKGSWSGEIWNRRKNGELYPEWLNIKVLKNDNGEITEYVGVFSDITIRKQTEEQLEYLAHYDVLTGLPNRSFFKKRLQTSMLHARQNQQSIALIFFDLDRFKTVNDSLGHSFGDRLLYQVGERLKCLQNVDTVSRWGGDEFTILLENITSINQIEVVANQIIKVISTPLIIDEHEIIITLSIGISVFPNDGDSIDKLIDHADTAMYLAKEHCNTFQFYSPEMNLNSSDRNKNGHWITHNIHNR